MNRNFQKLKTLDDWETLDEPLFVANVTEYRTPPKGQMILRMLVRPKYGDFCIPEELQWLEEPIRAMALVDKAMTGIEQSWCYVTVRSGSPRRTTDEWHFDGGSVRTELIPERNYVWCDKFPLQYKTGSVHFPKDFDPVKHNMFSYADQALKFEPIKTTLPEKWYMLSPFVFHRRDPASNGIHRTFVRISFVDIEVRDDNCTQNPLLRTDAFGRDPVTSFRNQLIDYEI